MSSPNYNAILLDISSPYAQLTFNRPTVLNACDYDFLSQSISSLSSLTKPVIISGNGGNFSAGGDIIQLVKTKSSPELAFNFAHSLGYCIASFPYEKISVLDGVALGGGLGFGLACDWKVLTSRSMLGFPEAKIGYVPDVGAAWHAHKLVSESLGLMLLLTGEIIVGTEAYFAGFSEIFVNEFTENMKKKLAEEGISGIKSEMVTPESGNSEILKVLPLVNQCFDYNFDVETVCNRLASVDNEWSRQALKKMRKNCPFSMKVAHQAFKRCSNLTLIDAIILDYNIAATTSEMQNSNFDIGITHRLINKLKTRPDWFPGQLYQVSDYEIEKLFKNFSKKPTQYKL
jgi:enoyl-CoA hydratase/carnithine racemase